MTGHSRIPTKAPLISPRRFRALIEAGIIGMALASLAVWWLA